MSLAGSGVGFSFGVKAWTEVKIRCVKGMYRLKLISSEKYSGLKGFKVSFFSVTSYLPMMATASASMCPLLIQSSAACRIELQ